MRYKHRFVAEPTSVLVLKEIMHRTRKNQLPLKEIAYRLNASVPFTTNEEYGCTRTTGDTSVREFLTEMCNGEALGKNGKIAVRFNDLSDHQQGLLSKAYSAVLAHWMEKERRKHAIQRKPVQGERLASVSPEVSPATPRAS